MPFLSLGALHVYLSNKTDLLHRGAHIFEFLDFCVFYYSVISLFLSCLLTCSSIRLEEQGKTGQSYLSHRVDPVKLQSMQQQVML